MDNAWKNGEGPSGVNKFQENHDQSMEFAEDATHPSYRIDKFSESIIQFSSSLGARRILISNPQNAAFREAEFRETRTRVKISWNHGGKQVAVTGSWDNWENMELLHNIGEKFVVIKTLPMGIFHYHFIVDGWLVYAPDLPWIRDDSGNSYNILDLQGSASELPESMSEFESPPSPPSSYDNQNMNEDDFSKPPPELPLQLQGTILNDPSSASADGPQFRGTPRGTELNHLFVQSNVGGQFVALGSTHRIRQKYVPMFLFKSLSRTR